MGWRTGLVAGVIATLAFSASAQEDLPGLPGEMVAAAGAFEAWTERAAGIDSGFTDKDAVAHGLTSAAPMDAGELEEGMIAYGALAALTDRRFVEGVREAGRYGDLAPAWPRVPTRSAKSTAPAKRRRGWTRRLPVAARRCSPPAPASSRPPTPSSIRLGPGKQWPTPRPDWRP